MGRLRILAVQIGVVAALMAATAEGADAPFFPPATPTQPVVETLHGVTLTDRYRWLEDGKDPVVLAWSRAQHAATLAYLDRAAPPVPGMRDEIARWYDRDRTERPFFKNGREFLKRAKRGEPAGEALHADRRPRGAAGRSHRHRFIRQDQDRCSGAQSRCLARRGRDLRTRHRNPGLPHRRHDDRRAGRPDDHRPPLVRMGARRGLRVRLPAHCRSRRAPGAASLLPAPARRRPRDRRAPDRDGRREELVPGLRARGRPAHRVRDRRFLVEHDQDPPDRLECGAADDLPERQVPGRRDLPP